jgi:lipopolysaccharide export system protein LptA
MNVSIERLRLWLLAGAGLLVIVIASFLGYAHYRAHRYLKDLPQKLGVDIRRETNNVTYSQSIQGKTVYTIHAAKAVERSDGKMTLHDVGIVLYGRKEDRADRIYGQEFEYDQKNEVIRAVGEVHIDLQAPQPGDANAKMDYAAGKDLQGGAMGEHEGKDDRLIHVTTSGLVFLRKLGVAATDKDIEFASGGMTGHAVGADYSADTGVVVLHAAVKVNGLQHDRPVVLTASHAVLDRPGQMIVLSQVKYVAIGDGVAGGRAGDRSVEGRTAEAQHVVVHLRRDGSAERVEATGEVTLTGEAGESVKAPRGEMMLTAQNQLQSAVMSGGVKYKEEQPLRQAQGEAAEGRAGFDKRGHPEHVVMTGGAHLKERVRGSDAATEPWSERELNAGAVELAVAVDSAGKAQLKDAKAAGDARLMVINAVRQEGTGGGSNGIGLKSGTTSSSLAGDVLTAHFVRIGNKDHLAEVHGEGHTTLRRVSPKGVVNTGSGDSLVAHFRPVTTDAGRGSGGSGHVKQSRKDGFEGGSADEVSDAVEQGHVVMTQLPVRKPGESTAPLEERVTAERAVFNGELERTTLTGNVQVSNGTSVLWADRVVTDQQTGDATADGLVKASYVQAGSAEEPVHVLAARAELKRDSEIATFHGAGSTLARLWQGASQVDAPVLQFSQKERRLVARGEGQGAPMAVHTVLVSGSSGARPTAEVARTKAVPGNASGKLIAGSKVDVIRVASRELQYSDVARKAEFTGGVEVESRDGSMRGQQALVFLEPAPSGKGSSQNIGNTDGLKRERASSGSGFMTGSVERIVVSGPVEMDQPGRRATGEQLVYTASDGLFVLTGTPAALPKVTDDQRGTVTGTSLRFHSGDDNIVVSNGGENGAGQRVRTETRVKNRQ